MRKPDFYVCENKDADQLCDNREADQRLCFRYTDSPTPYMYFKPLAILMWLYSLVCVGPGRKPRRPVFSKRGSIVCGDFTESSHYFNAPMQYTDDYVRVYITQTCPCNILHYYIPRKLFHSNCIGENIQ